MARALYGVNGISGGLVEMLTQNDTVAYHTWHQCTAKERHV